MRERLDKLEAEMADPKHQIASVLDVLERNIIMTAIANARPK